MCLCPRGASKVKSRGAIHESAVTLLVCLVHAKNLEEWTPNKYAPQQHSEFHAHAAKVCHVYWVVFSDLKVPH